MSTIIASVQQVAAKKQPDEFINSSARSYRILLPELLSAVEFCLLVLAVTTS